MYYSENLLDIEHLSCYCFRIKLVFFHSVFCNYLKKGNLCNIYFKTHIFLGIITDVRSVNA